MTHKYSTMLLALTLAAAFALRTGAQEVLPRPEQPFGGHIGLTIKDSTKDFPKEVQAPKGAPNILLIMTDDVGFGASSTFGGPIPTATLTVDGKPAGEGKIARTLPFRMSLDETLDCGEDTGTPVSEDYHVPFKFTGQIGKVAIRLGAEKLTPEEQREFDEIRGRGVMAE